ncbi:MAG: preprotein translocase subunit SecG [Candidatus Omnitrophica bacterium]|nr:preprotein translocase subunit SecG [Candidatus Omnitrophota bacterium]
MIIAIIVIHVLACISLIGIVLIQRGRGGGLVESFSGVESMFGTKTSAMLTRATTVLSVLFFITCLSLAAISLKQSKSLMRNVEPKPIAEAIKVEVQEEKPAGEEVVVREAAEPKVEVEQEVPQPE